MTVPLIFQPLVKYADFQGRARRSEFWLWVLFRFVLSRFVSALAFAFIGPGFMQFSLHAKDYAGDPEQFLRAYFAALSPMMHVLPFLSLIGLALLLPTLAVKVRRLHDINRSGWWALLPYVTLFAGLIVFCILGGTTVFTTLAAHPHGDLPDSDTLKLVFGFIGTAFLCILLPEIIAWIVMLVFFVTEGTKGPNRFGPDPKAISQSQEP